MTDFTFCPSARAERELKRRSRDSLGSSLGMAGTCIITDHSGPRAQLEENETSSVLKIWRVIMF